MSHLFCDDTQMIKINFWVSSFFVVMLLNREGTPNDEQEIQNIY